MENNVSPEEKLFKVIKEGVVQPETGGAGAIPAPDSSTGNLKLKQSPDLPAETNVKPSPGGSEAAAVPVVLPQAPPKSKPAEKSAPSPPSSFWGSFKGAAQALATRYASGAQYLTMFQRIEVINRSLAVVLVLLLGTFVYSTVLGRPSIEKTIGNFPRPPVRSLETDQQAAFMSADEYVKMVRQRDIFSREQRSTVKSAAVADKPDIPRIKTDLQLVGIYFEPAGPEVIIEDKAEKKTYFLKEGGNIKGIKIKSIREDRVILESNGVEWELM